MKNLILLVLFLATTVAHASATRTLDGQQITNGAATLTIPTTTDTLLGRTTTDTLTNKSISGATNTFTAIPTSAIAGSALSGTNTGDVTIGTANGLSLAGQVLSLQAATASVPGALTAADFVTFNGKQPAGNYITALTGSVIAAGPGSASSVLSSLVSAGSCTNCNITFNVEGRATAYANGTAAGSTIVGSRASPTAITAVGGISFTAATATDNYIQGSGGAVTVTANPQIAAGTVDGQRLVLIGRSATNTVTLADGTGLSLNGSWVGGLDSMIALRWDGTNWAEISRR